jgi:cation/acetate symporter
VIYHASTTAIIVFLGFVGFVLGLSFYLGRKAKSAAGYYAAHATIPWFVNGVAFAGDYLSAASFLGICGMIAFYGYDGFLYSIGYLAGWIVALFVIAEPIKRLGKFTFADAVDCKFQSRGIQLVAAISTLVVSIFYLIPQMVGAGALVRPLLGLPHWAGVLIVGVVVVTIVVTAGMVSTTWVQFIKGGLLVIFCFVLTILILQRGLSVPAEPVSGISPVKQFTQAEFDRLIIASGAKVDQGWAGDPQYYRFLPPNAGPMQVFRADKGPAGEKLYALCQTISTGGGSKQVNGLPQSEANDLRPVGHVARLEAGMAATGPIGPLEYLRQIGNSTIVLWRKAVLKDAQTKVETTVYYPVHTSGNEVLLPGGSPTFAKIKSDKPVDKLNFLSLMLALFCGTASLPHILIRYYTVKDGAAARKSTVVGIASIGFFYVLTLFLGLGAMTSGAMDVTDSNMAAPLLARTFGPLPFAFISAIAFTTVLGTVSGLILAASGAVAHDLMQNFLRIEMTDHQKVRAGKLVAVIVGILAMLLGIVFKDFNVTFLVGWAFNVAASANLPALVMLLFWKGTTKRGVAASILVGLMTSLGWIMLSGDAYANLYHLNPADAPMPFNQPGIVTIPLSFVVLVLVSLVTEKPAPATEPAPARA